VGVDARPSAQVPAPSPRSGLVTWLIETVANLVIGSKLFPDRMRWAALRAIGIRVNQSGIRSGVVFSGTDVHIGSETFVNEGVFFDAINARVTLGGKCSIGHQAMFLTSTHEVSTFKRRAGATVSRPVSVGDGVWIGARAVLLPGVTIGDGSVVAAGAVVTKSFPENSVIAGVPAKLIRSLD
jgi:maltose O-acetyltransferase